MASWNSYPRNRKGETKGSKSQATPTPSFTGYTHSADSWKPGEIFCTQELTDANDTVQRKAIEGKFLITGLLRPKWSHHQNSGKNLVCSSFGVKNVIEPRPHKSARVNNQVIMGEVVKRAIAGGDAEALAAERLDELGVDVNDTIGNDGYTPLHWACHYGKAEVSEVLSLGRRCSLSFFWWQAMHSYIT